MPRLATGTTAVAAVEAGSGVSVGVFSDFGVPEEVVVRMSAVVGEMPCRCVVYRDEDMMRRLRGAR